LGKIDRRKRAHNGPLCRPLAAAGEGINYPPREIRAEYLAYFTEGKMRHFGSIAWNGE
jgi:hypothetical protein